MSRLLRKFSTRRRPVERQAEFVNTFVEEDDDLQLYDFTVLTPRTTAQSQRPKGIMQRLQSWLGDHLPGGRKRRDGRRSDSETRKPISITGPLDSSTTRRELRMYGHLDGPVPRLAVAGGGELRRRAIQTNPWFPPPSDVSRSALARTSDLLDASYSSSLSQLTRDESLRINTLAGSYSSGYGSQDSSPECSVHTPSWQPSTQIVNRGSLVDKAVECRSLDLDAEMEARDEQHIYHELETSLLHRVSVAASAELDSCVSSELVGLACSTSDSSRAESPIYAIPYCSSANESRCGSIEYVDDSDAYLELLNRSSRPAHVEASPSFEYENGYARVRRFPQTLPPPPQFNIPPPPNFAPDQRSCLDLLDDQIAELKIQTKAVSRLVECAKERRELRDCARLMCLDHIERLRNMRWFVENGFELQI